MQGQRRLSSTTCPGPLRPAQAAAPPRRRLDPLAYYGQHSLESREIYRSQAKRGINLSFAYATAYLVLQGQRFTLAVTPVMRWSASRRYSRSCCSW